ncbi:CRISPR-associated endonuclease Cas2 [Neptunomonas sp.]|uniref:CRISPR-associated endonuclease Cas2 n=1 Tax=Neptunomonas sp. TaxID=1971898 RepID=UPI0035638682
MRVYLACFDIENDRKRRKLGNLLLTYGDRVQHSVFEISLKNEAELQRLCHQCENYVTEDDSLHFYWLNKESRSKSRDIWGEPIAVFPAAILL